MKSFEHSKVKKENENEVSLPCKLSASVKSYLTTARLPRLAEKPCFEVGVKLTGRLTDTAFKHLDGTLKGNISTRYRSV